MRWLRLAVLSSTLAALCPLACGAFGSEDTTTPTEAGVESDVVEDAAPLPPCDLATTSTDANHFGACNHSCLGGSCKDGKCQPVLIATEPTLSIFSVAVSNEHVAWMAGTGAQATGPGTLSICPKDGCARSGPKVLVNRSGSVAGDGASLFASFPYGPTANVSAVALTGLTEIPSLKKYNLPLWLIARDGVLFLNAFNVPDAGAYSRTIVRYSAQGGVQELGTYVSPPASRNTGPTAVSTDRVFLGAYNTGAIVSCPLASCSVWDDFRENVDAYVVSIATDDRRVFWANNEGELRSCSAKQSPCAELRADLVPADIEGRKVQRVAFGKDLLVVSTKEGALYGCNPEDCRGTKRIIATEPGFDAKLILDGNNIVIDKDAVYYAARDVSADGGGVSRLMKVAR